MSSPYEFMPLHQLKDKFPEDSWWVQYNPDSTEDHIAVYYNGDVTQPVLDLDWEKPFPQQKETTLLFIDGNLTVDKLYNRETDGAIGLMVMGNLTAKHMAVGGQEIYVKGNLLVEDILCGSYNHGETIVKGDLRAALLIEDDEYRFKVSGQQSVACMVNVWDGDGVYQELPVDIRDVLVDELFPDMDDEEIGFSFGTLVDMIEEGCSARKELKNALQRKNAVELYMTRNTPDEGNIRKLAQCVLMPADKHFFDLEEQGVYFKVNREYVGEDGDELNPGVYMTDDRNHYFMYVEEDQSVSLLTKTMDEGAQWEDLTDASQERLADFTNYWVMLLTCINVAELYLPRIDMRYMEDVLQHPAIWALDPEGEENDGFWDGSKYYSFRQAHTDEDGDDVHARIEIQTPDRAYYFYTLDNETYVSRHYQPPDQYGLQDISYLDAKRWEASERYFEKFKQFVSKEIEAGANTEETD